MAAVRLKGLPYFIMEYVEGKPLDVYAGDLHLSTAERIEIFLRVCSAVEYAHRRHIVHRDLKPTNILVKQDGTPKLLDFGIAKLVSAEDAGRGLDCRSCLPIVRPWAVLER